MPSEQGSGMASSRGASAGEGPAVCDTWLVFALGATDYAIDVSRVRTIIGLLPITRVPRLPESVRGVINLRGQVVPIVDLRIRFGLEAADHGQRTCIVVLQAAGSEFGVVVDRVIEVAHISAASIEEAPQFGADIDTDYLLGVAKHGQRVRLLLDMDRAMSRQEMAALAASAGSPPAVAEVA